MASGLTQSANTRTYFLAKLASANFWPAKGYEEQDNENGEEGLTSSFEVCSGICQPHPTPTPNSLSGCFCKSPWKRAVRRRILTMVCVLRTGPVPPSPQPACATAAAHLPLPESISQPAIAPTSCSSTGKLCITPRDTWPAPTIRGLRQRSRNG